MTLWCTFVGSVISSVTSAVMSSLSKQLNYWDALLGLSRSQWEWRANINKGNCLRKIIRSFMDCWWVENNPKTNIWQYYNNHRKVTITKKPSKVQFPPLLKDHGLFTNDLSLGKKHAFRLGSISDSPLWPHWILHSSQLAPLVPLWSPQHGHLLWGQRFWGNSLGLHGFKNDQVSVTGVVFGSKHIENITKLYTYISFLIDLQLDL